MKTTLDISGNKYVGLIAIERVSVIGGHAFWLCRCDCGKETTVPINNLLSGNTKSCGCLRRTHNMTDTKEHAAWSGMKDRCSNPNYKFREYYQGKGIVVCERWLHSFENFFEDMGFAPSEKHSLDRYPNRDGNYEPDNCRWATKEQQSRNRDYCVTVTYEGETMTILDWSKRLGIHRRAFDYARTYNKSLEGVIAKHLDKNYNPDDWEIPKPYDETKGIHLEYKGVKMAMTTWASVLGMEYNQLFKLIKDRGKTLDYVIEKMAA